MPDASDDDEDDDDEDEDDEDEEGSEDGSEDGDEEDNEDSEAASQDEIELASDQYDDDDDEEEDFDQVEQGDVELNSDEDMDGGFEDLEAGDDEDAEAATEAPNANIAAAYASRKTSKSALYAIPTLAEVQGLKETGELFKNNIFKLKVDEMLRRYDPPTTKPALLNLCFADCMSSSSRSNRSSPSQ